MSHIYAKVNRYENLQPPGDLWYHDHSMHITQDNVGHGLIGSYIIYDPEVDAQLPPREFDIFLVAGQHITRNRVVDTNTKIHTKLRQNPKIPFFAQAGAALMRNQTYRIRFLNGIFDSVFTNLRFKSECLEVSGAPIDPETCRKELRFSVIASDSALFNLPVHNVTRLTVSSAERFEILIVFDGNMGSVVENGLSAHARRVVLVDGSDTVKYEFVLLPKSSMANKYDKLPSQLMQLQGVHFYNLTQVNRLCAEVVVANPTTCISKLRMRPIFKKSGAHFFNGHYDFSKNGASDNPKIGTTEDWVFISITHRHPIHVHLINYQIIGTTTLKNYSFNANATDFHCTFYEMDYWVAAGLIAPSDNLTLLCLQAMQVDILNETTQAILSKAFPEDGVNSDNASVSGFDVFKEIANQSEWKWYNTQTDCVNGYKYICGPVSNKDIPEEYRRWKEVALLDNRTVLVLRIRWASTDYLVNGKGSYPYFNTPEDQLIEYPGYVYHCHFLQHEDNKLMRSFMMQPSD
jgi:FtsP/CotA-like multicopper oxidase with cupredoxin domain